MILDHGKLIAFGEIDDIASVYEKMIEEREKEVPKKKNKKNLRQRKSRSLKMNISIILEIVSR